MLAYLCQGSLYETNPVSFPTLNGMVEFYGKLVGKYTKYST